MFSFTISWFIYDSFGPSAAKRAQERKRRRKKYTQSHTLCKCGMTHFQVAERLIPARAHMCKNIPRHWWGCAFLQLPPYANPPLGSQRNICILTSCIAYSQTAVLDRESVGLRWGKLTMCNPEEGSGCLTAPWVPCMMRENCWHVKPQ